MAIVWLAPPKYDVSIAAANDHHLPCPFSDVVCRWYIRAVSSSFVGSITIKARPSGSGDAFSNVEYFTAIDDAEVAAGTAIANSSFWIWVDGTAKDIDIDCTAYTSGTLDVSCIPVVG
jgi:hypothetical protein